MKHLIVPLLLGLAAAPAMAKLPTPTLDAAAQLKAEEAKARTAWQTRVEAFQLCRSQDRAVAHYKKTAANKPAVPVPGGATASVATTPPTTGTPTTGTPATGAPAASPAQAAAPAGPTTGTPPATTTVAAGAGAAPCSDPGPFAFTPPEQKPLESSGAHSPPGTASSPPSNSQPAAATPAKKP